MNSCIRGREEATVTKTLIDIDDARLELARRALGTPTKKDTVNTALAEVAALAARRRDLVRLTLDELRDLRDDELMSQLWRR
jgi:Arc/MetJ family transcription regulator